MLLQAAARIPGRWASLKVALGKSSLVLKGGLQVGCAVGGATLTVGVGSAVLCDNIVPVGVYGGDLGRLAQEVTEFSRKKINLLNEVHHRTFLDLKEQIAEALEDIEDVLKSAEGYEYEAEVLLERLRDGDPDKRLSEGAMLTPISVHAFAFSNGMALGISLIKMCIKLLTQHGLALSQWMSTLPALTIEMAGDVMDSSVTYGIFLLAGLCLRVALSKYLNSPKRIAEWEDELTIVADEFELPEEDNIEDIDTSTLTDEQFEEFCFMFAGLLREARGEQGADEIEAYVTRLLTFLSVERQLDKTVKQMRSITQLNGDFAKSSVVQDAESAYEASQKLQKELEQRDDDLKAQRNQHLIDMAKLETYSSQLRVRSHQANAHVEEGEMKLKTAQLYGGGLTSGLTAGATVGLLGDLFNRNFLPGAAVLSGVYSTGAFLVDAAIQQRVNIIQGRHLSRKQVATHLENLLERSPLSAIRKGHSSY